ncbi:MAG TPA: response regulator [Thermoanaerobaculia bacterium]|nr:response regulator [Thermoanaerobaculia bacterium]
MSPKRILVIDDEDDIREVTAMTLEMVGEYLVTTAADGAEGILCAYYDPPDAILLDVMMPVMDGPTTLAWLRDHENTAQIPVIFLTAKVQPADRRRFADLGVMGFIAKPFDPMQLPSEIQRILGW